MKKRQKAKIIKHIQDIIKEYGAFNINELEYESPLVINSIGENIIQLAELFTKDYIATTVYIHNNATEYIDVEYENLSEDILLNIELLAEGYEVDQLKTQKRISN